VSELGPIRTCVGCGQRAAQRELVRFVLGAGTLMLDASRRQPGRGAYLHGSPACWDVFTRRRGPVRSLRATPTREQREHLVARLSGDVLTEAQR
jgi:hypothetical protein